MKQRSTDSRGQHGHALPLLRWSDQTGQQSHPTASTRTVASVDLGEFASGRRFGAILADPPWRFANRTGKMAPEHRRLSRYGTLTTDEIAALPISAIKRRRRSPPTAATPGKVVARF